MKKKRAATEHVASISLTDLVKYFNLPIVEASKNLNVGLTVLKRKCREFGIPRWPHRKIKSLDTLIHNLQVIFVSTINTFRSHMQTCANHQLILVFMSLITRKSKEKVLSYFSIVSLLDTENTILNHIC